MFSGRAPVSKSPNNQVRVHPGGATFQKYYRTSGNFWQGKWAFWYYKDTRGVAHTDGMHAIQGYGPLLRHCRHSLTPGSCNARATSTASSKGRNGFGCRRRLPADTGLACCERPTRLFEDELGPSQWPHPCQPLHQTTGAKGASRLKHLLQIKCVPFEKGERCYYS